MDPGIGDSKGLHPMRQNNNLWLAKGALRKLASKLGTMNSGRRARSLSWAGAPSSSSSSSSSSAAASVSASSTRSSKYNGKDLQEITDHHRDRLHSDIPAGHLAVYVGEGEDVQRHYRRFVVKTACLSHPIFKALLARVGDEFGFRFPGPLTIPCDPLFFQYLLCIIDQSTSHNPPHHHHHHHHHSHHKSNNNCNRHGCSSCIDPSHDKPHDRLLDHLLRLYQAQLQPPPLSTTTPSSRSDHHSSHPHDLIIADRNPTKSTLHLGHGHDYSNTNTPARAPSRSLSSPNLPLVTASTHRAQASDQSLCSALHNMVAD